VDATQKVARLDRSAMRPLRGTGDTATRAVSRIDAPPAVAEPLEAIDKRRGARRVAQHVPIFDDLSTIWARSGRRPDAPSARAGPQCEDLAMQIQQLGHVVGRDASHPALGADAPLALSG
jgi:hypothetical protein